MSNLPPYGNSQPAPEPQSSEPAWSWEATPSSTSTRPVIRQGNTVLHYCIGAAVGAIIAGSAVFFAIGGISKLGPNSSSQPPAASTPVTAPVLTVEAVKGKTLLVALSSSGAVVIITISSSTTFKLGDLPGTATDIAIGDQIQVKGKKGIGGDVTADRVLILLPTLSGTVLRINSTGLVLQDSTYRTFKVTMNQQTKISSATTNQAVIASDIQVGASVKAMCVIGASGTLTAVSVVESA